MAVNLHCTLYTLHYPVYKVQHMGTLYRAQHMGTLIKMITTGSGTIDAEPRMTLVIGRCKTKYGD